MSTNQIELTLLIVQLVKRVDGVNVTCILYIRFNRKYTALKTVYLRNKLILPSDFAWQVSVVSKLESPTDDI